MNASFRPFLFVSPATDWQPSVYPTSYTVVAVRGPSLLKILNCISGRKLMGWMDGINKVSRNCFPKLKYICKKYYGNLFNNCTTLVFAKVVD